MLMKIQEAIKKLMFVDEYIIVDLCLVKISYLWLNVYCVTSLLKKLMGVV